MTIPNWMFFFWQSQYWSNAQRSRSCQALPAVNSFAQTRGPVLTTCANKAQPCPRSRSPWSSGSKRRVVHSVSKTSLSSGHYQFSIGLQCIWFDGDYSKVHQRTGAAWSPIDHWCGFVVKVNMQMPWNAKEPHRFPWDSFLSNWTSHPLYFIAAYAFHVH